jgi:hypothetical protein
MMSSLQKAGGVEARRESLGQYHLDEGTYKRSMGKLSANSRHNYTDWVKLGCAGGWPPIPLPNLVLPQAPTRPARQEPYRAS